MKDNPLFAEEIVLVFAGDRMIAPALPGYKSSSRTMP